VAKKKNVEVDPESEELFVEPEVIKPKAKRKAAPRKKAHPVEAVAPVQIDSIGKISEIETPEPAEEMPVEEIDPEELKERKPNFLPNADFLAPDNRSFQLKERRTSRANRKWLRSTLYVLGTVVILLAIAILAFSYYSAKKLTSNDNSNQTQSDTAVDTQSQTLKMNIVNLPSDLQDLVSSAISSKFSDKVSINNITEQLPNVTNDTLFVKSSAQNLAADLLAQLSSIGIKAELESNDAMTSDIAFYGVTILSKPDLGAQTAAVYNATGVSGLAKKNCDVLKTYNVSSCNPLNATNTQTGTVVEYKNDKALMVLRRTNEYKGATYKKAGTDQVEDIRVTLGK
jgi:cytoskeletal protein RodZ